MQPPQLLTMAAFTSIMWACKTAACRDEKRNRRFPFPFKQQLLLLLLPELALLTHPSFTVSQLWGTQGLSGMQACLLYKWFPLLAVALNNRVLLTLRSELGDDMKGCNGRKGDWESPQAQVEQHCL